ncbi:MAG: GntR family transcriptional regulator [Rhodospirillales bacterium]|nr:GntR family transcriptional regulator [Rhodospirillales bacterium]
MERIQSGIYAPGQVVIARDLMGELGLSKAPVREGIHVLVGEGVMELLPNRSARIRNLTERDLLDFTEVWSAVAGVNFRLAAECLSTDADRDRVTRALDAIQQSAISRVPYDFFMAVANLHSILASINGNAVIQTIISRAHFAHFYRHLERLFPGHYWVEHLEAFRLAGDAILSGRGADAEAIYRLHMRWVRDILVTNLDGRWA